MLKRIKKMHTKEMIKIGIIGAGLITQDLHLPVLSNIKKFDINWICDKEEKKAKKLAKLFKIPIFYSDIKLCSDFDIVLVAIPVGYRA